MIVVDASALLELLAKTPRGNQIVVRIRSESMLHVPHLVDVEIASALRRQAILGVMTHERAHQALLAFQWLPLRRYPHLRLVQRIWELRLNFSSYDACYLALAETLDGTLLTCDIALRSAPLRRGQVEVI